MAIKILDKEKIQKQNMGAQIKKEVRGAARRGAAALLAAAARRWGGRPNESSPGALPLHSRARPPRARLQISIMKMVKHDHIVKLYEVLASRTKVRACACRACARAACAATGSSRARA